ncbi:hypothetical protein GQ43DRAFT_466495 [Delitschia confertaspora ATCC 74209]|uniref:Uncharacterized protein n=1 Tax=Delitschia confertaspora ATCC 74209 TaxID=1513339 RepID=A0A9P4JG51_9PLEO|nr:hypothetical protein GQ43DRAFT_466495 [Delitschia confertaspora ATCC 74209]
MCQIVERVYIARDGSRRKEEEKSLCSKARRPYLCSQVSRKTMEYFTDAPSLREDTASPLSVGPSTPTGSYRVQQIEPSAATQRPTTRDGTTRKINPQIIIEFGKKGKEKKYESKRFSLGAHSIASSNEVNIDTPGSASPIRTGFHATVPPPTGYPGGYHTIMAKPTSHHRHTSSSSSFTTSSKPPSLYTTSEPGSPTTGRRTHRQPTVVHNPLPSMPPPSPSAAHPAPTSTQSYRIVTPERTSHDNVMSDGLYPLDYSDARIPSASSNANLSRAAAPEITDRDVDRARLRHMNAEAERRRQEEADAQLANSAAEENARQAKIEIGRYKNRAKERAEKQLAESEKRRAEERQRAREEKNRAREEEEIREAKEKRAEKTAMKERNRREDEEAARRKQQAEEADTRRATEQRKERDNRLPTREKPLTSTRKSRRVSVSQEISQRERAVLLAETEAQMQREREAAEAREATEQNALLWQQQQQRQQQQQQQHYYDPRRSDQLPIPNHGPGLGRRGSVSVRRDSISAPTLPIGGFAQPSRPVSIHQAAPPNLNLAPPNSIIDKTNYSMRGPSKFSSGSTAQPPARPYQFPPTTHHAVFDEPYNTTALYQSQGAQSSARYADPVPQTKYSTRDSRPQPHLRQPSHDEQLPTLRHRGEQVISQAEATERARQATRGLSKAVGFEQDYQESDDDEWASRKGKRSGAGAGRRRGL